MAFAGRGFPGLGDCIYTGFIFLLASAEKRGVPHLLSLTGWNSSLTKHMGEGYLILRTSRTRCRRCLCRYFTSGLWCSQVREPEMCQPAARTERQRGQQGGVWAARESSPSTSQPAKHGPRASAQVQEMGFCAGSLSYSATKLEYDVVTVFVMAVTFSCPKICLWLKSKTDCVAAL